MSSPSQHRSSHKTPSRNHHQASHHGVRATSQQFSPRVPHRANRADDDDADGKVPAHGNRSQLFTSKSQDPVTPHNKQAKKNPSFQRLQDANRRYTQSPTMSNMARQTRSQPLSNPSAHYEPHISQQEAAEGVKQKLLFQGRLRVNQKKVTEAYVPGGQFNRNDFLISGLENRNRALDGDLVVIKLQPKNEWAILQQDLVADNVHKQIFGANGASSKTSLEPISQVTSSASLASLTSSSASLALSSSDVSPSSASEESQAAEAFLTETFSELALASTGADDDIHVVLLEGLPENASVDEIRELLRDVKLVDFKLVKTYETASALVHLICIFANHRDRNDGFKRLQLRKVRTIEITSSIPSLDTILGLVRDSIPPKYLRPTAKVVYVSTESRDDRPIIGTLQFLKADSVSLDASKAMVNPSDARMPFVVVPCPPEFRANPQAWTTQLVAASISDWPAEQLYPNGRVVKAIGPLGDILAETKAILYANNVPAEEIPEELCASLPRSTPDKPWVIPKEEIARRRDCRDVLVCTIDPPTARDLDDALSCRELENGNFEIIVHIADVSHFLEAGSALDELARARATTTYLVQECYPMLPRVLSEQLCSLNPGEDRCSFSIGWEITPEAEIVSEWASKSVIHSHARLTYDHAQRIIENPELEWDDTMPPVKAPYTYIDIIDAVTNMQKIAVKLRAQRFANGALRIENVKMTFKLDADGNPVDCKPYIIRDANKLVEEFMLLANMAAARRIYTAFPECALLRRHDEPNAKKLEQSANILAKHGYLVDPTSSLTIQQSLTDIMQTRPKADFYVVQHLLTIPMQTAKYFCTADREPEEFYHYALAVPYYTHFTSPIRRYADVIVHRLLACSLNHEPFHLSGEAVEHIADTCNQRKAAAKKASDESASLFLWAYMANKGSLKEEAVVLGVLDYSFDVLIVRLGINLRINLQLQNQELAYQSTAEKINVTWIRSKQHQTIKLGSTVTINLMPYRRDIRPDVQGRLVEPIDASLYAPQTRAGVEDEREDDDEEEIVEANLGHDEVD